MRAAQGGGERMSALTASVPACELHQGDLVILPLREGDLFCDVRRLHTPGGTGVVLIDYRTTLEGDTGTTSLLSTDRIVRVREARAA